MEIKSRKNDHIRICLEENVQASRNFWDDINLSHRSIPKCDLSDIDTKIQLMGKELKMPLLISSMTGGSPQARKFNDLLARAAEEFGIGLGVGSQRAGIEDPGYRDSYEVIERYDIPLVMGNLGFPQLADNVSGTVYDETQVEEAIDMINADAICLHLNYLQEIVQPEGDNYVVGSLERVRKLSSKYRIIAKETGGGISRRDARVLKEAGVSVLDVGGMSGTTFSGVESFREDPTGRSERLGKMLWDWGIPTPVSVIVANVGIPIIATGGLRNGLDLARSIAIGAGAGGMAWNLLRAANKGYGSLKKEIEMIREELKAVMFLTGSSDIQDLSQVNHSFSMDLKRFVDQYHG